MGTQTNLTTQQISWGDSEEPISMYYKHYKKIHSKLYWELETIVETYSCQTSWNFTYRIFLETSYLWMKVWELGQVNRYYVFYVVL